MVIKGGNLYRVAIVGAGPGGLVAARYLKAHWFEPVLFDLAGDIGGQWNAGAPLSGIWPAMRTNTSRITTCFSDLSHASHLPVYITNQEVLAYLHRYADCFDLWPHIRLNSRIERIERAENAWEVQYTNQDQPTRTELFPRVIVASGRYHKPMIPAISGLDTFTGRGGISHAFHYKGPDTYRGQRVVVAGCSISSLEIASDLALLGADRVISTYRRQRYIFNRLNAGLPVEYTALSRFNALAAAHMPAHEFAAFFKENWLRLCGSPEQYGALKPADNILEAGITQAIFYLPLVAEGRIITKPWIESIEGRAVQFCDGSREEADAIIFGTGFDLSMPYLSEEIQRELGLDAQHLDLYKFTFHPRLEGLAFLGLFEQSGPYLPVLELQARWIAYAWSGLRPLPPLAELETGLQAYRSRRGQSQMQRMNSLSILFAREAGVEPELSRWPSLARALLFGPMSAVSFRLQGPDSLPDAPARFARDAAAFGAVPTPEFSPEQRAKLELLTQACPNTELGAVVHRLLHEPDYSSAGDTRMSL